MTRFLLICLFLSSVTFSLETPQRFDRAVEAAKKMGLDKEPEVKADIDKLLYRRYTSRLVSENRKVLEPSDEDLKRAYADKPLVRVRHLVLAYSEADRAKADKILGKVKKEIASGADFKKIVMKYSQDDGAKYGGDLDFRGFNSLPPEFYAKVIALKKNQITEPIIAENAIHMFQLTDAKSYDAAFPTYLQLLRVNLREERLDAFLDGTLGISGAGK